MNKLMLVLLVVFGLSLFGCQQGYTSTPASTNGGAPQTTGSGTATVTISGFAFSPATSTVAVGTSVTWVQEDSVPHTIVADNGGFESTKLSKGQSWSHTFSTAGTYPYHCSIHPSMKGKIVVE